MSWDWEKLKRQQQHGGGRGGGLGLPPDLEDFINKIKAFRLPGGLGSGPIIIGLILLLAIGFSMVYKIDRNEEGVVQRFGKYVRTGHPGLNFKWPSGIESVTIVNVTETQREEFGFASERPQRGRRFSSGSEGINVSLMLTGDLNVGLVPWIVQYRIKDSYNFLFKVQDPKGLLRDMSEATMRMVVGDRSINEVISKRDEIAVEAQQLLQLELDKAETGINIINLEMKKTNVPAPVQQSFNAVNQAVQEKEQMIYQAREDYNKAIPAARGEAERTIKAAEGYALDRVNRGKGDAKRFLAVYNEYAKAKDVTKRRLYLEMLQELFPKLGDKYIIDADQKNLLPLLNLGKVNGAQQ
ncbi:MAG: FtsH protease activity modulator HflK [Desulfobacterales bacterium]